ncbi:CD209 antigen-like protein B [Drosophila subpulchrella]|uniref:CD209 antigen-like protein B n=1 Tax=Drosophila subpulchrella TaxID=1486046 RepID=UPI0018A13A1A|nr:CD209 antigen-like protein B [Drosophila subpulchrella]
MVGCPYGSTAAGKPSEDLETRCNGHFFTRLRPVMDLVQSNQDQWDTCKKIIAKGVQEEEKQIKIQLDAMQESLLSVKTSLEAAFETKIENQFENLMQNLKKLIPQDFDARLRSIERQIISKEFEKNPRRIENQTGTESEHQVKLEGQPEILQDTLNKPMQGFKKIGSKFFYIENGYTLNWESAESACREMGAQLADIENMQESKDLYASLIYNRSYWLGISARAKEVTFISVASGKQAPFLKWKPGQPNSGLSDRRCVSFYFGEMWDARCSNTHFFICKADKCV